MALDLKAAIDLRRWERHMATKAAINATMTYDTGAGTFSWPVRIRPKPWCTPERYARLSRMHSAYHRRRR